MDLIKASLSASVKYYFSKASSTTDICSHLTRDINLASPHVPLNVVRVFRRSLSRDADPSILRFLGFGEGGLEYGSQNVPVVSTGAKM
ncbi:hypothetical protein EWB00_000852 [Schistosoma japonicum]|uniref:Uncharacterized protein n=1 Tax=Schistosoma japonicum TaxID=6182 RepID=A0A4Z2CK17_SCHJA|nr:hypothetical protein EWB00_000852 [Schistosoma japonicum]